MGWEVLLNTSVTTVTNYTIKNVNTYKFLSIELRFNGLLIAQMLIPASQYSQVRNISGFVDASQHIAIGQIVFNSPTSVKAWVCSQVNGNNIYVMIRGIR